MSSDRFTRSKHKLHRLREFEEGLWLFLPGVRMDFSLLQIVNLSHRVAGQKWMVGQMLGSDCLLCQEWWAVLV